MKDSENTTMRWYSEKVPRNGKVTRGTAHLPPAREGSGLPLSQCWPISSCLAPVRMPESASSWSQAQYKPSQHSKQGLPTSSSARHT